MLWDLLLYFFSILHFQLSALLKTTQNHINFVKNHIFSLLRSGQRPKNSAKIDYVPIEDVDIASKNEPEADWIEKEAFLGIKKRIFEILSKFELEVLQLYLGGFSYKAIGEKLGKSEKSVGNALSRVRKKLRAEIGPEY